MIKIASQATFCEGDGVLLVGHGSRSEDGRRELVALGDLSARAVAPIPLRTGFLELSDPPALDALEELASCGVRRVAVVPLMLNPAGHAKNDVPAVVIEGRRRYPGIEFTYGRALGVEHTTISLARSRIETSGGHGLPLLVVARGTTEPEANADGARVARLLAELCDAPTVVTGFSGLTWPLVPAALEQCRLLGASAIVQFAWYLCTGVLVDRMREEGADFAKRTGVDVIWAGHLGPDPELAPLVAARAAEALAGEVKMSCDLCSYRAPFPGLEDRVGQARGVGHSHLAVEHLTHGHSHAPASEGPRVEPPITATRPPTC